MTYLHIYAADGELEKLEQELSDRKTAIDVRDRLKQTPLHVAAYNGNSAIVQLLLKNDAYIYAVDEDLNTPLHSAIKGARFKIDAEKFKEFCTIIVLLLTHEAQLRQQFPTHYLNKPHLLEMKDAVNETPFGWLDEHLVQLQNATVKKRMKDIKKHLLETATKISKIEKTSSSPTNHVDLSNIIDIKTSYSTTIALTQDNLRQRKKPQASINDFRKEELEKSAAPVSVNYWTRFFINPFKLLKNAAIKPAELSLITPPRSPSITLTKSQ